MQSKKEKDVFVEDRSNLASAFVLSYPPLGLVQTHGPTKQ